MINRYWNEAAVLSRNKKINWNYTENTWHGLCHMHTCYRCTWMVWYILWLWTSRIMFRFIIWYDVFLFVIRFVALKFLFCYLSIVCLLTPNEKPKTIPFASSSSLSGDLPIYILIVVVHDDYCIAHLYCVLLLLLQPRLPQSLTQIILP